MNLETRLKRLETRIKPLTAITEHKFDFDQLVSRAGLDPAAIRALAASNGCSLVAAFCAVLGIEVREFKSHLMELAGIVR